MVAVNFTRKRVSSLTLGEKLRKIRRDHRISLSEVSRSTKIQARYLEALENGVYSQLPPEVYVRGFLRSYAGFLGVPEDAILKLYERERSIQKNLGHVESPQFQPKTPISFSFSPSPKMLWGTAIALVSLMFFSYLYYEFRAFVSEPRLVILEPADKQSFQVTDIVIRGETDPRATVAINDEEVPVDEEGRFSEKLQLNPGLNVISVTSMNRFGKKRQESVSVEAIPPAAATADSGVPDITSATHVSLSIRAEKRATISAKADGSPVFSGVIGAGEEKSFSAVEMIDIASESGNALFVKVDGHDEELFSQSGGPVEAVFGKDGRISGKSQ